MEACRYVRLAIARRCAVDSLLRHARAPQLRESASDLAWLATPSQLPCGRLVILCETCALEFYDVLIKKIAKFESHFEEFLLEQQDKKEGTTAQSATRVESPAWPGNAGSTGTTTHDVEQRTPQPGELAPHRRPGTSSSPERRRSDFFGGVSKQKGEFPSSPSTPSRDDMIVTRGEYKGGLSGMLDPRRRTTSRHVNSPGGNAFEFRLDMRC